MVYTARLSVVLVTYNSAELLPAVIDALPAWCEIIAVDNNSSDDTLSRLAQLARPITVIPRSANSGFAVAVNEGVAQASGEYVLLLNPDALIDEIAVSTVLSTLDADKTVGIASPHVLEGDGTLSTLAAGFEPTIWRMLMHSTGLARLSRGRGLLRGYYLLRGQLGSALTRDVGWVSGGCMFVRRGVWDQLAGLSERWFMYAEDVEFGLRALDAGHRVVIVTQAHATHAVGMSSEAADSPRMPKTLWLESLFDLYRSRYSAGPIRQRIWAWSVSVGFSMRHWVVQRLVRRGSIADEYSARRFAAYARAARSLPALPAPSHHT